MEKQFKLTDKFQHSKRLGNGKRRSLLSYYINDVLIFRQKVPFDEQADYGVSKWRISNVYLLNGRIHQTRSDMTWDNERLLYITKSRDVTYPVSKSKLEVLGIPFDLKIEM